MPAGADSSGNRPGERRLAERLKAKLKGDQLCWYNVALGPTVFHPDFVVFHPQGDC